ncbi:MAG TPA: DUF362 domain-containing protein [Bryobacteraceae bacterium]|jgi:uncharacterized protein (DUF362 family)|nr:DUF362 domain-containing protein [Bryobacteraceae bacterium]
MASGVNRRSLFQLAGAAALLRAKVAGAQQAKPRPVNFGGHPEAFPVPDFRSTVAIAHSGERRKNVYTALKSIDKEMKAKMKGRKYVVLKPNFVNTTNQLAASHADSMRGILDYLSESFRGPVVIAESSAGDTKEAFDNFKYPALASEYRRQQVKLIDLNDEAQFERVALLDSDLHIVPCRIAARLVDPEAFVISACMLKTHNSVIASLSIKNMVLGAPLHQATGENPHWNEKRKFHVGLRQMHYNMMVMAQRLNWGASLIDGYEGMEGNGPNSGTPVASRIALASTDYVAADRVAAETMGIDPEWLGYVKYCGDLGLGQFDSSKIDVIGAKVAEVKKAYRMHPDIERELKWQGPLTGMPVNLGWVQALGYTREG